MTSQVQQEERHDFQAEVSRLLHLMVHSVYSEKEIFLRELISNASDACDQLRHLALTQPELTADGAEFGITVGVDKNAGTIAVSDNGIGMSHDDLVANLGTIARSGTAAFVDQLTGDAKKDVSLIGQFGVGFYSAFMVADKVQVLTRKAGEEKAWQWESDGLGSYTVVPAEKAGRGTDVILTIREDDKEYLEPERLRHIIKTYSDHIAFPISLVEGQAAEGERVNEASALWARPKSEITEEQYTEFYHHVAHAMDEPWMRLHFKAEGMIEYTVLLFVPSTRPFDLYDPARKPNVKLYVKRVFITDDCEEILPGYLRFLRGVIDSEDLPLNISREMLQNNPVVAKIRQAVTKRVLSALEDKAAKDPEGYATFWETFGSVLKEGIYEDAAQRDTLLKLARFCTTKSETPTSLADYVGRMKDDQKAIYYITGDDLDAVRRSPQLEGFTSRDIEVLLLTDPVDDFWLQIVGEHDGKPLRSVTRGADELADAKDEESDDSDVPSEAEMGTLIAALKQALGDAVKDVRTSKRLTDSPVCLVADEGDLDMHLQKMLRQHQQIMTEAPRVLEVNPKHALIRQLAKMATEKGAAEALEDPAWLLLDQARIFEGEALPDPKAFIARLSSVMEKGLTAG